MWGAWRGGLLWVWGPEMGEIKAHIRLGVIWVPLPTGLGWGNREKNLVGGQGWRTLREDAVWGGDYDRRLSDRSGSREES